MGKRIRVVAAVIREGENLLLARRLPGSSHPLLWEFPGGKVKPGEGDGETARRELKEELGIEAEPSGKLMEFDYAYPGEEITFAVYQCKITGGSPAPSRVQEFGWFSPEEALSLPMTPPDRSILRGLLLKEAESIFKDIAGLHGKEYILLAMAGVARRQGWPVKVPKPSPGFSPIIKVYEMVEKEVERLVFALLMDGEVEDGAVHLEELLGILMKN